MIIMNLFSRGNISKTIYEFSNYYIYVDNISLISNKTFYMPFYILNIFLNAIKNLKFWNF